MKVCVLTHTFPRHKKDFVAPFMDGVASGIQAAGNEVFVLIPWTPGFKRKKTDQKYKIITYKYIFPDRLHKLGFSQTLTNDMGLKPIMWLLAPLMYFFGFLALLTLVEREKIDIVNAHWILPNGFIAGLVSLFAGVPVVSTLPGSDVYMAEKNALFSWMARFATKHSAAVTSNSPQLLDDLARINTKDKNEQRELKKKFQPIIYGVDPGKFKPNKSWGEKIRKELNIPKGNLVILGVGRLVAKKGFRYLIKAAPAVLNKNKNVNFVVIGEGDRRKGLEDLAKKLNVYEKFRFPGWADYEKLAHYYNLGDVFILPSVRDEEGNLDDQSVSVVEAMACGKPIVTTDFPGYKIVVEDGGNGFLIKEENSKEIADGLIKLLASRELRERMGRRSRDLIIEKFSWKAIGRQYTKVFKSLVK